MGFTQSTNARPRGLTRTRPATAMANRDADEEAGQPTQPKGMKNLPYSQQHHPQCPNLRNAASQPPDFSQPRRRDFSGLHRQFQDLSLDDQPHGSSSGGQAFKPAQQPPCRTSQSDVQTESITPTKALNEEAARSNPFGLANSEGTPALLPTTPSQVKLDEGLEVVNSLLRSFRMRPSSPTKSSSPRKLLFLSKDSNVTSFTGWDVDGRLNEFESQFKVMKEAFEGTVTDRKAMEEAIDLAKNRGMCLEVVATRVEC